MYSGVGWGCCSDILEAVMGASGAKTRYFLLFPRLKHAERASSALARKGFTVSVVGSYSLLIPPIKFKEIINEIICQSSSAATIGSP